MGLPEVPDRSSPIRRLGIGAGSQASRPGEEAAGVRLTPPGAPRARRRGPRRADEAVDDQQRDAEIDRRVGEVEDEEVAAERVQIEEVDDRAVDESIVAVADRAADDQAEAEADQRARARATATVRSAR